IFPDGGAPRGGLIVVGSHVAVTTRQLQRLRAVNGDLTDIEIDVARVLATETASAYLAEIVDATVAALETGDVVVSTTRTV
ncbi:nucleotide-binding domain containing protein, partial [Streptococcus suis]|uniref:nucleotide-binding domain containing protein n=1 Tax=Streptococcus suis TaxID=1307 RepID=UPI00370C9EBE